MRSSSARQLTLELFDTVQVSHAPEGPGADEGRGTRGGESNEPAKIEFPNFSPGRRAFAATSRQAGRINAASISEKEYAALLAERQLLLDRKFAGTLDRKGTCRLEYVRWSLDRIEDARYGMALDMLESKVADYEDYLHHINDLKQHLERHVVRRRK